MTTDTLAEPTMTVSEPQHTELGVESVDNKSIENNNTLRDCVEATLVNYFAQLDGAPVTDVYQLVLTEVEAPLLEQVMKYTRNNQTKASVMLGLNRGTLTTKN